MCARMRELFVALCTALTLLVVAIATPAQAQRTHEGFAVCTTYSGGQFAVALIYPPEFSDSSNPLFFHTLSWSAYVYYYDHTGTYKTWTWTGWYVKPGTGRWIPLTFYQTWAYPFGAVAAVTTLYDWDTGQYLHIPNAVSGCPTR